MLLGVYIIVDDEVDAPIYGEPSPTELDDGVWAAICEIVEELQDGDKEPRGTANVGETVVGWRALLKSGLTFFAVATDDVKPQHVELYLQKLAKKYADEVDDWRSPDKAGVVDVVVDVIPPWEDDGG